MSRFDESLRPMVAALVARAGTAMTLRREGEPLYTPSTGEVAAAATSLSVAGVIEDVETGHADGLVRRGDRMVTLAAQDLQTDPVPGDSLLIGGVTHRVVSVTASYAGDRPAAYRLHVRR